jgi:hypothetical protein
MKIINIDVANRFQGKNNLETKGIGKLLYQNLEKQVPVGTEFYFAGNDNLAPEFWKKMGFQERSTPIVDNSTNTKEYYKKV